MNNLTPADFVRVNNDINGNPRYVCHFLHFVPSNIGAGVDKYRFAVRFANKFGGRKYHTKKYGGGIVFQSYNLQHLCNVLNEAFTINNSQSLAERIVEKVNNC